MKILSIQSSVAYGHVGNSAAVFPLQRLGHEVWPVLTVHFSNHTGYGEWRGPLLAPDDVREVIRGIEDRGVLGQADAVLSGYQGDPAVGSVILDAVARVKELTEGRGAEAVIAAIGHRSANDQGWAMLSDKGRYVLFAAAHPEPEFTIKPNEAHNRETGVFGVLSGEKQDFYTAARLVRYGLVDLRPLIDAHHPLADLSAALDQAIKPGTYRVIVEM